jgi:uncharacterized membrane protein YccF (DUF307 family)
MVIRRAVPAVVAVIANIVLQAVPVAFVRKKQRLKKFTAPAPHHNAGPQQKKVQGAPGVRDPADIAGNMEDRIMNTLGNIIWLIFGGFIAAIGYLIGGFLLCLTIIGIPFGLECFKLGILVLWPFGKKVVSSSESSGCVYLLFNILWIVFGGVWVAITHIVFGFLLFITIIGIPFARQHFKLVEISLMPFGKQILDD